MLGPALDRCHICSPAAVESRRRLLSVLILNDDTGEVPRGRVGALRGTSSTRTDKRTTAWVEKVSSVHGLVLRSRPLVGGYAGIGSGALAVATSRLAGLNKSDELFVFHRRYRLADIGEARRLSRHKTVTTGLAPKGAHDTSCGNSRSCADARGPGISGPPQHTDATSAYQAARAHRLFSDGVGCPSKLARHCYLVRLAVPAHRNFPFLASSYDSTSRAPGFQPVGCWLQNDRDQLAVLMPSVTILRAAADCGVGAAG